MFRTAESRMRKTSDSLAGQLDHLIESASDLLDNLNDQRGDAVEGLRSRASRNIHHAGERLASLKPKVMDTGARAAHTAVDVARRNPWATVAVGTVLVASIATILYASLSED